MFMLHKFRKLLCFDTSTNPEQPPPAADPRLDCAVVRPELGYVQLIYLTGWGIPTAPPPFPIPKPLTIPVIPASAQSMKVQGESRLINANYESVCRAHFHYINEAQLSHFDFHIAAGKNQEKTKAINIQKLRKTKAANRENKGKHFTGLSLPLLPPNRNGPRRSCSFSRLH